MDPKQQADAFLKGAQLRFTEANDLWQTLKKADEIALARQVLEHVGETGALLDKVPADRPLRQKRCRELALLTSKDPELAASLRHDAALAILANEYDLADPALNGNAEVLGIAAGIHKRRWQDLGRLQDLQAAAALYTRGAGSELGEDAYAHINAAFLDDVLASLGDDAATRSDRARRLRERIVKELPAVPENWFNTATRAEALFGLGRYPEATEVVVAAAAQRPDPWQLRTTAQQLGQLAHLRESSPMDLPQVQAFFAALLPGSGDAAASVVRGKVGLALSGGGFRASFYHLGVLARLAEHDMLRHVEVLSCVSGGSIVGACYWLALRRRLLEPKPMQRDDYVVLVRELIAHFVWAVDSDLRVQAQPSGLQVVRRLLTDALGLIDAQGLIDSEKVASLLDERFYRPLLSRNDWGPIQMDKLPFTPADHDPKLVGPGNFNPTKHNWLRAHKVPALVLNATTVNTGHAWQFTSTWMGESPWSIDEAADSVRRLEWSWYAPEADWRIELGRAVAASACIPGVFSPLSLKGKYQDEVHVQLVDGGVHDNQGTVSLLAMNCNVVLVSDACGQLLFQKAPATGVKGLASYALRSQDILMERIRQANFADLHARRISGQLQGLLFVHMKDGLDAEVVPRLTSQQVRILQRAAVAPNGVRCDFQRALAELRTDLNRFTADESAALMACGYQMAGHAIARDLAGSAGLVKQADCAEWPFQAMLEEITSTAEGTPRRKELLAAFARGRKARFKT